LIRACALILTPMPEVDLDLAVYPPPIDLDQAFEQTLKNRSHQRLKITGP